MPAAESSLALPALVVSISSAAVTLIGLTWNLWLYRLQGARLKVQLVFSYAEDGSRTWSVNETKKRIAFSDINMEHINPFGIEYGRVRVTNVGRTAVSVENISFDLARPRRWSIRRIRHTIQPSVFHHKDEPQEAADQVLDLSRPHRLEPGDNITADFHLWPGLGYPDYGTLGGDVILRGSAHAVGRKSATRSRRRTAWRLPARSWTRFSDVDVTPELRVFRELWFETRSRDTGSFIALLMYRDINNMLAEGATREQVNDFLDKHTKHLNEGRGTPNGILAFEIHNAFHNETPALWTLPDEKQVKRKWWTRSPSRPTPPSAPNA